MSKESEALLLSATIVTEEFAHSHRDALECHEVSEDEREGDCYALALARAVKAATRAATRMPSPHSAGCSCDLCPCDVVKAMHAAAFPEEK